METKGGGGGGGEREKDAVLQTGFENCLSAYYIALISTQFSGQFVRIY